MENRTAPIGSVPIKSAGGIPTVSVQPWRICPRNCYPLVVLNILMPTTCCGKNMVKTERSIENKYLYLLSLWYNESPHYGGSRMVVVPYLPSLWYNSLAQYLLNLQVVAPYLLSLWYNRQKIQSRKTQLFRVPFP